MEIEQLPMLDMTSDETRIYYAVEWTNSLGERYVDVYAQPDSRDKHARHMADNPSSGMRVMVYDIRCPFNTDIDEAQDFARDNARING